MSNEIKMPALSPTMTEGILSKWLVKIGDEIRSGDVIAEIETDKATMEVEAVDDGIVTQLVVEEGTQAVPVGTVIATISGDSSYELETKSQNKETPQVEPSITSPVIEPVVASAKRDVTLAQVMEWDGPVKNMTVREALRDAMAEEMRVDDKIFIMGEEVAEYQGAYKVCLLYTSDAADD